MADVFSISIYDRSLSDIISELDKEYRSMGVKTKIAGSDAKNLSVTFEKDFDSLGGSFGMGQSVTANFTTYGNTMTVKLETGDWTRKKIMLIIGPLLWGIPDIVTLIGILRQNKLKEQIKSDIYKLCNSVQ